MSPLEETLWLTFFIVVGTVQIVACGLLGYLVYLQFRNDAREFDRRFLARKRRGKQ